MGKVTRASNPLCGTVLCVIGRPGIPQILTEDAKATALERVLQTFETNAQPWRLEAVRFAHLMSVDALSAPSGGVRTDALVALDGLELEIGCFQRFGGDRKGVAVEVTVRLAEVAVALQTARTRLRSALARD